MTGLSSMSAARTSEGTLAWFLAAWLFDYRALDGDRVAVVFQIAGATVSALCAARYLATGRKLPWPAHRFVRAALFFVGFTATVGLVRGQAPGTIATTAAPILLFVGGIALTYDALSASAEPDRIRALVLALVLISVILKPFVHFVTTEDLSLSEVRFQIVSGAMVLLMAHCILAIFHNFRLRDMLITTLVVAIVAAAVTRGYLLIGAAMVLFNVVLFSKVVRSGRFVRSAFMVGTALILLTAASADSCELVIERWQERLTKQDDLDYDITTASRLAEVAFQFEAITSSADRALLGSGIAAPTQGSGEYADFFFALFPDQELFSIGFGHNGPVSLVFVGGFVVGGLAILAMLVLVWLAAKFAREHLRTVSTNPVAWIGCWGGTSTVGALVGSLSGGIFTQRAESLYLGVSVGMLLWARQQPEAKSSQPEAR
jgi:hypothetical protein